MKKRLWVIILLRESDLQQWPHQVVGSELLQEADEVLLASALMVGEDEKEEEEEEAAVLFL
ncbi:hypothetical protein CH63R_11002 [Colletotrichum higginsianum IMI 349063]|uniref:Uncharacterized protein n=1 Tax=Colletotrichum higginsianum (strain IMI 349063) TaxID=759273 RepID=A0A1B7Y4C6_COLHI|nr:uncharacterized protein CH63R_11002 [Colletotrichum higginsianum IMI 349063]OBR06882.1 hypothetical protein CH63R_11002 [Colletotrichum higginsianum IMI 349063]